MIDDIINIRKLVLFRAKIADSIDNNIVLLQLTQYLVIILIANSIDESRWNQGPVT